MKDAVYRSLREPVPPTMYIPYAQQPEPPSFMSVSVRAAGGSPALLTRSLAAGLSGVNRDIAITFRPLADQVAASLTQERIVAMLSVFFGGLALLLAALGLYGVTSYAVSRRRTEIGIRMALGAAPAGVIRMVLTRVAILVGLGVIIGSGDQPVGSAVRLDAALRPAAARSGHDRRGVRGARHHRGARGLAARTSCGPHRSGAGLTRRMRGNRVIARSGDRVMASGDRVIGRLETDDLIADHPIADPIADHPIADPIADHLDRRSPDLLTEISDA